MKLTLQAERIFWKAYFSKMKLRPGIGKLLQHLRQRGLKLAIVTDLTTSLQMAKLAKLHLTNYFDFIVTSEEVGHDKPHPAIVRLVLQKLQLTANQVVLIGDSLTKDRTVAKHYRIPFIQLAKPSDVTTLLTKLDRASR